MKLLLGATVALLLGALAVSWQGMNNGVKNAPPDELARLKKQIEEVRADQMKIELEKLRSQQAPANASSAELDAVKLQLEQSKLALAEMDQKSKDKRNKKVAQDEEGLLAGRDLENKDTELRRARMISDALLIGRVKEYVADPQAGGFVTFEVLMPDQVQTGAIIAIRRKTGILGQLKVSQVEADGAIANPMPGFGPIQPVLGDELILPPQY